MNITLLNTTDPIWDDMLGRCVHDIYHTPGWARTSEVSEGGSGFGAYVRCGDAEMFIPLLKRNIRDDYWDAISPYGYAGPICSEHADQDFLDAAFVEIIDLLKCQGCVSWFLRLHPIINADWRIGSGLTVEHGPTVSMNLGETEEDIWLGLSGAHQRGIRKAQQQGVSVTVDHARQHLDEFIALYHTDMRRLGASSYYLFGREYFDKLFSELPQDAILMLARQQGHLAGGVIFTLSRSSGIIQYHLSTTNVEYRALQPAKLIIHTTAQWGKRAGYRRLHLGGGIGAAEDSLFAFKRGFGGELHRFRSQRVIINHPIYRQLSQVGADQPLDDAGFFPAYRK
jgi:hypothetical protein